MGCSGAMRLDRGLGGGQRDDRWGASSKMGAASVSMARSKAEAFGALVETTVFLLVTLTMADKAGVVESRMGWGKNQISLVQEGFPSVSSFLGLLGV